MIWLSGHTHSGTTLLQTLLDGHPECLVYPVEPYFQVSFTRDAEVSPSRAHHNFLFKLRNQLHCGPEAIRFGMKLEEANPFDFDRVSRFLQKIAREKKISKINWEQFDHSKFFDVYYSRLLGQMQQNPEGNRKFNVNAAFDALRAAVAATLPELVFGSRMVFKQPVGRLRPGVSDWFFEAWPGGKMVFLVRNPYARVWSHIRQEVALGRSNVRLATDSTQFKKIAKWYAQDHAQSLALPENSNILKIKYEDLATKPEEIMNQVCEFVEIEYSQNCLTSSVFGHEINPTTNRTGKSTINAGSLHKWKSNLTRMEKTVIGYYIARARARRIYRPQNFTWSA